MSTWTGWLSGKMPRATYRIISEVMHGVGGGGDGGGGGGDACCWCWCFVLLGVERDSLLVNAGVDVGILHA